MAVVAVQCTGRLAAGDWPGLLAGCLTPMATTAPPRPPRHGGAEV